MAKYRLLRERLIDGRHCSPRAICTCRIRSAWDDLRLVHDAGLRRRRARTERWRRDAQRRIGFPWSPMMVERSRRSVGATLAAAHERSSATAVEAVGHERASRSPANLAGGTHHAFRDRGEGYCVFNDVAVAARGAAARRRDRARRGRRLRRPSGQRHRRHLSRRSVGLHVLAARREEFSVPQGSQRPRRHIRGRHRRRRVSRGARRAPAGRARRPAARPGLLSRRRRSVRRRSARAAEAHHRRAARRATASCSTPAATAISGRRRDERRLRARRRRHRHHSRQHDPRGRGSAVTLPASHSPTGVPCPSASAS